MIQTGTAGLILAVVLGRAGCNNIEGKTMNESGTKTDRFDDGICRQKGI